jgi:hypothetical protein
MLMQTATSLRVLGFGLLTMLLLLAGCGTTRPPSETEVRSLATPPPDVKAWLDRAYPNVLAWHQQSEVGLLAQGRVLTDRESAAAKRMGVLSPEKIRVVVTKSFPMPQDEAVRAEVSNLGWSNSERGRTMGYAVLLKSESTNGIEALAHEFVHVAQAERMGRSVFVRRWMVEMKMVGARRAPLEVVAIERQKKF